MTKDEIAAIFSEIGTFLELQGANPFRVRAYEGAAHTLESLDRDLKDIIEEGKLTDLPGIGKDLAEKIETLYKTGKLEYYEKLKKEIKPGLIEMLGLSGLGPKKIKALHEKLGIDSIGKLKEFCEAGKVSSLSGFGKKTEEKILESIKHKVEYSKRHLWWKANEVAQELLNELKKVKGVKQVDEGGSLRRKLETVGDIDLLVASDDPEPVMACFTKHKDVESVIGSGTTKSSVRLRGGMQADLRVIPVEQYYFALHHFTGSKAHNVKLRHIALEQGYSLSEWGLKPTKEDKKKKEITVKSEAELFKKLGFHYIPPELREGLDELDIAKKGDLPKLVEVKDIKGVFHNHTTASDGRNTLNEMVKAAQDMGWEYYGVADHSKSSFQANGLSEDRLLDQVEEIKKLNKSKKYKIYVFTGVECDILKNGKLDFSDNILKQLDYVVISVHSSFSLSEEDQTKRIIKALENPHVTMLGHLTGRLLLKREPYKVNIQKVIDAAIANNVIMELNANPQRLDMDWRHWRKAAEKGLKCCINPDAHSTDHLNFYTAGVNIARKGWLTKKDVVNTKSLKQIKTTLSKSTS